MVGADPVARAVVLAPDIVSLSERRHVSVELAGRQTRGQTTVDWFGRGGQPPNAEVVLELQGDRFWEMLRAAVE
jgi:purine nucleosidase